MDTKRKILVVDDNSGNRLLLKYNLEGYFETDFANSGESAILKFKETNYDLILMDIQMPELDGIETTKQIRSMEDSDQIPIFAVTSCMFRDQRIRCMDAGMNDYILKPIHAKSLVERINYYLNS